MAVDFNFHTGLIFGIDADSVHEMDDNNNLTGKQQPAITIYLGFVSVMFIFM